MIVSLYASGMTIRDIGHHLVSTIGTELSHETISKITDDVSDEVLARQHRPLEALHPVIYLDRIVVKVRDGGHVGNKVAHIAVGVGMTPSSFPRSGASNQPRAIQAEPRSKPPAAMSSPTRLAGPGPHDHPQEIGSS